MVKRCICEICTCGRHRCPHRPTNHFGTGQQCNLTEYNNTYKAHAIPERVSFKPSPAPMQGGEFQDGTTQRTDFKQHPLERPFKHQPDQYIKPQGEMDTRTSYKADYVEKHGPRAQAIRHEPQRQVNARFEGEPTYKSDYKKWDGTQRQQPIVNQAAWARPTAPFEGQTTFQRDFKQNEIPQRISYKPNEGARISDAPFENRTSHRDAFIQHPLERPFQREREQYKAPSAKLDGLTTFRRDYQGAMGGPSHSFKPLGRPFQSEAPFEDGTTNRNDFKRWPTEKPQFHAHEVYRKPEGEMEMNTTHNATYKEMPIERVLAKRPHSSKKSNAPFDGTTNYSMDFKGFRGERAMAPKGPEYVPNNAPFEGNSTYQGHFVQHAQAPTHSFKPTQAPMRSDAKFEDGTNYRTDYTPKPIQICEAALIDKNNSRYRFTELDQKGHKFYVPVETTITPLQTRSPMQQNRGPPMAMSVA